MSYNLSNHNNVRVAYHLDKDVEEDDRSLSIGSTDIGAPHGFIPVVKLLERKTWSPDRFVPTMGIVVRMMDMVNRSGKTMRPCYECIQSSEGIHSYLEYWDGDIILSSIMPDLMNYYLEVDQYDEIITTCKPDYCFTPDSETYRGEDQLSAREIDRTLDEAKELIHKHPDTKFIALPKGANVEQIGEHAQSLSELGLTTGVLHAGELLWKNRKLQRYNERVAIKYAMAIQEHIPNLLIYGIGTQKAFRMFESFDGVIVQSHISNSFYGTGITSPNIKIKGSHTISQETIMATLATIHRQYEKIRNDTSWKSTLNGDYSTQKYITDTCDEMAVV